MTLATKSGLWSGPDHIGPASYMLINTRLDRGYHTYVHSVTTFWTRRIDGGTRGRFVLKIDRARLFVRLFYDPPQFLLVKGRASRADVVDGRFAFTECKLDCD